MAAKKPLVISAAGEIQQLQSGDQLDLDSPTMTTQAPNDNSLKGANTAYVDNAVAAGGVSPVNKLFIYYNFI